MVYSVCHTVPTVDEFDVSEYPEGVRIYKPLTNKTAPRVAIDAVNPQPVVFGTGIAFGGGRTIRAWSVNGKDDRVIGRGAVGEVVPVSLEGDDSLILEVELVITTDMSAQLEPLVAYLHLLGLYTIHVQTYPLLYTLLTHRPSLHNRSHSRECARLTNRRLSHIHMLCGRQSTTHSHLLP